MATPEIEAVMGDQNKLAKSQRESVINDNALAVNNGVLAIQKQDLEKATGSLANQFISGRPRGLQELIAEKLNAAQTASQSEQQPER